MTIVTTDVERKLIRMEASLPRDQEELMRQERQMKQALSSLVAKTGYCHLLVIPSGILPQEWATGLVSSMETHQQAGLRRIAVVTSSALTKLQVRRIGPDDAEISFFETEEEALVWLAP